MGMPALLTQNGTGTTAIWQPDWMQVPFNIGIGTICNSTASYQVEYCMDDLDVLIATSLQTSAFTAGNATWYPVSTTTLFQASTTLSISFPVTGLRINVKSGQIGSTVSANFIQATFGR